MDNKIEEIKMFLSNDNVLKLKDDEEEKKNEVNL